MARRISIKAVALILALLYVSQVQASVWDVCRKIFSDQEHRPKRRILLDGIQNGALDPRVLLSAQPAVAEIARPDARTKIVFVVTDSIGNPVSGAQIIINGRPTAYETNKSGLVSVTVQKAPNTVAVSKLSYLTVKTPYMQGTTTLDIKLPDNPLFISGDFPAYDGYDRRGVQTYEQRQKSISAYNSLGNLTSYTITYYIPVFFTYEGRGIYDGTDGSEWIPTGSVVDTAGQTEYIYKNLNGQKTYKPIVNRPGVWRGSGGALLSYNSRLGYWVQTDGKSGQSFKPFGPKD